MTSEVNQYKTDYLALLPYLEMEGLKKVGAKIEKDLRGRVKVYYYFEDPHFVGPDLYRRFINSKRKTYRDLLIHYRMEIKQLLKNVKEA